MVQKEYAGTESESETEKLLRKALEDYEDKKFVAKADTLTVGELLDMWAEEELKTVTAEHLQAFLDLLTFGGEFPDGKVRKGYSKDYIHSFSTVPLLSVPVFSSSSAHMSRSSPTVRLSAFATNFLSS